VLLLLVDILMFRFVIKFSILESLGWIVFLFLQASPCYCFCCCYCYCFSAIATVVPVGKRVRLRHNSLEHIELVLHGHTAAVVLRLVDC